MYINTGLKMSKKRSAKYKFDFDTNFFLQNLLSIDLFVMKNIRKIMKITDSRIYVKVDKEGHRWQIKRELTLDTNIKRMAKV
jgi:hypothetical protein